MLVSWVSVVTIDAGEKYCNFRVTTARNQNLLAHPPDLLKKSQNNSCGSSSAPFCSCGTCLRNQKRCRIRPEAGEALGLSRTGDLAILHENGSFFVTPTFSAEIRRILCWSLLGHPLPSATSRPTANMLTPVDAPRSTNHPREQPRTDFHA